jgi:hypothetical protein
MAGGVPTNQLSCSFSFLCLRVADWKSAFIWGSTCPAEHVEQRVVREDTNQGITSPRPSPEERETHEKWKMSSSFVYLSDQISFYEIFLVGVRLVHWLCLVPPPEAWRKVAPLISIRLSVC